MADAGEIFLKVIFVKYSFTMDRIGLVLLGIDAD